MTFVYVALTSHLSMTLVIVPISYQQLQKPDFFITQVERVSRKVIYFTDLSKSIVGQ